MYVFIYLCVYIYIYIMKFVAHMAVLITFIHITLVPIFIIVYMVECFVCCLRMYVPVDAA
jgi:hypothetical protein